ncbi:Fe(2+) transporter permease subunit FeoB [Pseudaeromonas sharmana]|uniref:Ferrous iron transport protein B n=1 Tax=Pseudaeromonas sharmana TaxID=328412 RepID=A0ABV8CQM9_9GAMM
MKWNLMTVGNPNSGKTSLFNALTGANQQVGNWSGVTVDKKSGSFSVQDQHYQLIDLPGIYALESRDSSIDEQIAYRYVLTHQPDLVVNVIDASALERSLLLTLQLRELGLPLLVILNKYDVVKKRRQSVDVDALARILGCPVVALSAYNRKEVQALKTKLPDYIAAARQPALSLDYGAEFEALIAQLQPLVTHEHFSTRGSAVRLLEQDQLLLEQQDERVKSLLPSLQVQATGMDAELTLADVRFGFIHNQARSCLQQHGKLSVKASERIDNLLLNRWIGIPVFLLVMYLMFLFSINVGSAFIDFFDIFAGALFVDGIRHWLSAWGTPEWLVSVLSDGVGSGIQTVATFIPVVGFLYLFLAVLEASGYLARAAFVVDRVMRKLGLPGKAFVPMLMGFGCSVPAFMAARTLNAERERLMTSAMAPFMSCGARLPVYALFAVAFFPESGQNLVFLLYLIGIAVAIVTGLVLRKTLLPGTSESMLMEMPDYEIPRPTYVLIKTWHKLRSFIFGAGKTIVLMVTALSMLNSLGTDGSFGNQDSEKSVLSHVAMAVTPVLSPLGIREDNWQATVGIATGIFAKEAVVGTLNSLYQSPVGEEEGEFSLLDSFYEALASIHENLQAINPWDPAGLELGDLEDKNAMAEEQEVSLSTYANMQTHFDGQVGAFAYLLFILLYMPCAAAMGSLVRETGRNWAIFTALWCNVMAFMISTLYYQLATFAAHPLQSLAWVAFYMVSAVLIWWGMHRKGNILARKVVLV